MGVFDDPIQYMSQQKLDALQHELRDLKDERIPELARRIDDARQMGDLSENAEYHNAREEMAWAQSRVKELQYILVNASLIASNEKSDMVQVGSIIMVEVQGKKKEFTIVGGQEADPVHGKISNESPLGEAFLGRKKGDSIEVEVPAGRQLYKIIEIQ